jgi:quercetin dioxygenase-like cupin family protein
VAQNSMSAVEKQLKDLGGEITHHFSDGLYAKESFVPANTSIMKHMHDFSHLSILAKGRVAVLKGEVIEIIDAPACIEIKANVVHGITAMSDCVWFCIHATDEKDPSKVDDVLIRGE